MKIYLFTRTDISAASAFRVYYIKENLKVLKKISFAYVCSFVVILLWAALFHIDLDVVTHIPGLHKSFYISLFAGPIFYISSYVLLKNFKLKKSYLRLSQSVVIAFSLYVISRGMLNAFHLTNNPRNSLTMYLIWLIIVGVFFVLEYYETLLIALVCIAAFAIMLPQYQTGATELTKNNLVSAILLAIFYFVSRHIYSYRANHFIQLKTIQEKNLEIENTNHLKDEILGIVAHDLRNPLGAIESLATLIRSDGKELSDDHKESLDMIMASCEKSRSIINDLIEVARNDSIENFGVEEIELNSFLEGVVKEWIHNKPGSALVFKGTRKKVYTRVNKEKIQRVMDNLISNAIKFSTDGTKVEVLLKQANGKCIIEVKDMGLGIPSELLPYVFDRFSKAGRKGVRGEDSVGMGLNIARQIIKKHGGDITVESVEQKGTTFTIALPQ